MTLKWNDEGERLPSGTILHIRQSGLKIASVKGYCSTYWRLGEPLGEGNLIVYEAAPVRLEEVSKGDDGEGIVAEEVEAGGKEKRKRTTTTESEKGALDISV